MPIFNLRTHTRRRSRTRGFAIAALTVAIPVMFSPAAPALDISYTTSALATFAPDEKATDPPTESVRPIDPPDDWPGGDPTQTADLLAAIASLDAAPERALETKGLREVVQLAGETMATAADPTQVLAAVPQELRSAFPEFFPEAGFSEASIAAFVRQSGLNIPPCPPAGGARLVPGFPIPYGAYTPNPLNNWCMPNSVTGGCSYFPDRSPFWDFGAACRQHDLAYRWKPVPSEDRMLVEHALLADALDDCAYRSVGSRAICRHAAMTMFLATTIFGGPFYGSGETAGYSTGPLQVDPSVLDSGGICAQSTHAWLYVGEFSERVVRGTPVYPTAVTKAFSRTRFRFFGPNGTLALEHTTRAADRNCVVRHERERFNSTLLPAGLYRVEVSLVPWETNRLETRTLWLETIDYTGNTSCRQTSHPIMWSPAGEPVPVGGTVYFSGVVRPSTSVAFQILDGNGVARLVHTTRPAGSNCVIAHEPERRSLAGLPAGRYRLRATFTEWETNQLRTTERDLAIGSGWQTSVTGEGGGEDATAPIEAAPVELLSE